MVRDGAPWDARSLTEEVKSRARRYGFDLVGIVSASDLDAVPSHWIGHRDYRCYTKKTTDYLDCARSLLIMGVRVWDDVFETVIKVRGHDEYPEEWRGQYYARRLVRFLEGEGYKVVLEPDLLSKKRMAQLAGLGNFGKNTLIINSEYGPWFRLRSILTDAELIPDRPFTDDLCGGCDRCIKSCPVGALTPYKLDPDRCLLGLTWEQRRSDEFGKIWDEHCPPLTRNTYLMCMTCQRACTHGRELRGLD